MATSLRCRTESRAKCPLVPTSWQSPHPTSCSCPTSCTAMRSGLLAARHSSHGSRTSGSAATRSRKSSDAYRRSSYCSSMTPPATHPRSTGSQAWPGPPGLDVCPASTVPTTNGLTLESAGASTRTGGRQRTAARPWCSASTARWPPSPRPVVPRRAPRWCRDQDRGSWPSFSLTAGWATKRWAFGRRERRATSAQALKTPSARPSAPTNATSTAATFSPNGNGASSRQ